MALLLETLTIDQLDPVLVALRDWQHDGPLVQLHSGDIGWHWRFGVDAVTSSLLVWYFDEQIFAIGFRDAPDLVRMAVAPGIERDDRRLQALVDDLGVPGRVFSAGTAFVEARCGEAVARSFAEAGWVPDEAWTPLSRSLLEQIEEPSLRYEAVDATTASERALVQRSAFANSTFDVEKWTTMSAGPLYRDARCLLGFDENDLPVAAVTVWSAGLGRPGLLEPMGVHRDHRGRGYGRGICHAAQRTLQELGSSSAIVCTKSTNTAAVATYVSAGFTAHPVVRDWRRDELVVQ